MKYSKIHRFDSDEEISDWISTLDLPEDEEVMIPNGLAEACIGITHSEPYQLIYSKQLIIRTLMEKEELSEEDALEHMDYNILSSYVGPNTPIWVDTMLG